MPRALRATRALSSIAACLIIAILPALLPTSSRAADPPAAAPDQEFDLLWGVRIPMRDGVQLNATVFKPPAMKAPLPVVFTLTPYISDTYHDHGTYFASNGYVFAIVDARGRGNFFADPSFWAAKLRRLYREQRRFIDLPDLVGLPGARRRRPPPARAASSATGSSTTANRCRPISM